MLNDWVANNPAVKGFKNKIKQAWELILQSWSQKLDIPSESLVNKQQSTHRKIAIPSLTPAPGFWRNVPKPCKERRPSVSHTPHPQWMHERRRKFDHSTLWRNGRGDNFLSRDHGDQEQSCSTNINKWRMHFNRVFHGKSSTFGYPHFKKPLEYQEQSVSALLVPSEIMLCWCHQPVASQKETAFFSPRFKV